MDGPLATSTPKKSKVKGGKCHDKEKSKKKSDGPSELNIRRVENSDDDFVDPQAKNDRPPFSHVESVFYKHLAQQRVSDELLKNKK